MRKQIWALDSDSNTFCPSSSRLALTSQRNWLPNLIGDWLPANFHPSFRIVITNFFTINHKSLHIWATHTLTLSYTRITSVQVQTLLLAFPRIDMVATPHPNLDSALPIQKCFLLRERQDNVFKCDYVSTTIRQTNLLTGRTKMSPLKPLLDWPSIPGVQIPQTEVWIVSRPHDVASSPRCVIIITKLFCFQGS